MGTIITIALLCIGIGTIGTVIMCGQLDKKEMEREQKRRSANVAALTDQRKDDGV